jgi:flagellar motor protein MotB
MSVVTRKLGYVLISCLVTVSMQVVAADVDEAPLGEVVERHLSADVPPMQWVQDPERIEEELGDSFEVRETLGDELETIKLSGLVPSIHFESGVAKIPGSTVVSLGEILERMRDRMNVRLHLIGHADNRPLSPALQEIYGDNAGLSRERAGQVAEHFQTSLGLPPEAISYEWAGDLDPVASNLTEAGRALNRRVEVEVWYDESKDKLTLEEVLVPHEISRIKVCRMETVCKLRYVDGHARRARVQNLIAPLGYEAETIEVDGRFIESVRQGFENLSDKQNVIVKFVGYSDDMPLAGRTARIYGDHVGLSKARARRVALAVQDELELPTSVIQSDGRGSERPIGSNDTERGRALNRRVEVEFWYDDPLQELPDEPQLCPESAGAEMLTKVYDPPWGRIADISFEEGQPVLPAGYSGVLARLQTYLTRPSHGCVLSVTRATNDSLDALPLCTVTTSGFPPHGHVVRWNWSPKTCSLNPVNASTKGAVMCIRMTSSTPASFKVRHRTLQSRLSMMSWQFSTTTKVLISRASRASSARRTRWP